MQGTRKVITSELLNATDSDNNNAELIYSVLNQPGSNNNGFVAKFEAPNVPLTAFSQEDIDLGRIVYAQVNNMTDEDRIALQVRIIFYWCRSILEIWRAVALIFSAKLKLISGIRSTRTYCTNGLIDFSGIRGGIIGTNFKRVCAK